MDSLLKKKNLTSKVGFLIFLAALLLYSLASPGNLPGDTEIRWSVARQIVRGRGFSIEDTVQTLNYAIGIDGKKYSFYGPGQSLCLIPFTAVGLVCEKITGINSKTCDLLAQFLSSIILFPAIGAAVVRLFYRLLLLLGFNFKVSLYTAAVLAFGSMHFHYSVNTHEQTQVAVFIILALILMAKNERRPSFLYAWLFCVSLGICLLFRPSALVLILPVYLVAAGSEILYSSKSIFIKSLGKWLAAGVCGTIGFVIFLGWYNYIRFGSCLQSGYQISITALGGHNMFESQPLPTLAAMLFSPGKSILLYNPVLLLLPFCLVKFSKQHKLAALASFGAVVGSFLFHSFFTAWAGDYAWGLRYQAAVLPLLIMPLAGLFSKPVKPSAKKVIMFVIIISCLTQLASVVYNFNLEFVQNPNHCVIPDSWVWDWSQSHLIKRFENTARHITERRDFSSVPVSHEEPLLRKVNHTPEMVRKAYYVNFFPFKAKALSDSIRLFYLLLSFWLVLLLVFCAAALKLRQSYLRGTG